MSHRAGLFVLVALLLAGCARKDPYYCPGRNHNDNCAEPPEPTPCTSNDQCAEPTGVCDVTGSMTCVQCTPDQPGACTGATSACGEDRTCRACQAHPECPASDACLPDGSCVDPAQIAYVKPPSLGGTDNPSCTLAMPCTKVASALATGRPYVKLAGTNDEGGTVSIDSRNVILLAERDAKLVRTSNGLHVEVKGTSQVEIYDLEISGATGAQGFGISMPTGNTATLTLRRVKVSDNAGGGIVANGGALTVSQSTVSNNLGGGISVTGAGSTFDITNCLIFRNGNSNAATVGGASLATSGGTNVFEFNTVVDNQIQNSGVLAGGVFCDIANFVGANNIIARNFVNNDANRANSNTSGLCTYPTSSISTTVAGLNFISPDNAPHNYRILPGSTAIDQATTPSNLSVDIDGDPRTQGSAPDQGADEYKPQ